MHSFELTEALAGIEGAEVSIRRGELNIGIPALGDTAVLDPDEVVGVDAVFVPTGKPAVQLDIRVGRGVHPLIVTVDDLVFTPAYAADLARPGTALRVPAMPNLIAYSEMHRDVRALGKAINDPAADFDPETLAATLLAHRCFIAGAIRVGLWPVRVAAWWEYANASVGHTVPLVSLRPDEEWDDLMADVAEARRRTETAAAE